MKTQIVILLFALTLIASCKKEDNIYFEPMNNIIACEVDDPLNELNWLKTLIINGRNPCDINFIDYVWVQELEGNDIIVISFGLRNYKYAPYNCSGNTVFISDIDFYNSLSEEKLIYKYI